MGLLEDAAAELYAADLDAFIPLRTVLAKNAPDAATRKAITALRKPTLSAFTVNRLARTDPGRLDELATLGGRMRRAQHGTDAAELRELTKQRRELLSALTRRAFEVIGQQAPSAAQHEEVSATFQAALADPDLAEQLRAGTLVRCASGSGFGFSAPELSVVRTVPRRPDGGAPASAVVASDPATPAGAATADTAGAVLPAAPTSASSPPDSPPGAEATSATSAAADADIERIAAARRAQTRERARAAAVAAAQEEVATADALMAAAVEHIDATQAQIRSLGQQLLEAKRDLDQLHQAAKAAEARQRRARAALHRVGGGQPGGSAH